MKMEKIYFHSLKRKINSWALAWAAPNKVPIDNDLPFTQFSGCKQGWGSALLLHLLSALPCLVDHFLQSLKVLLLLHSVHSSPRVFRSTLIPSCRLPAACQIVFPLRPIASSTQCHLCLFVSLPCVLKSQHFIPCNFHLTFYFNLPMFIFLHILEVYTCFPSGCIFGLSLLRILGHKFIKITFVPLASKLSLLCPELKT